MCTQSSQTSKGPLRQSTMSKKHQKRTCAPMCGVGEPVNPTKQKVCRGVVANVHKSKSSDLLGSRQRQKDTKRNMCKEEFVQQCAEQKKQLSPPNRNSLRPVGVVSDVNTSQATQQTSQKVDNVKKIKKWKMHHGAVCNGFFLNFQNHVYTSQDRPLRDLLGSRQCQKNTRNKHVLCTGYSPWHISHRDFTLDKSKTSTIGQQWTYWHTSHRYWKSDKSQSSICVPQFFRWHTSHRDWKVDKS